MSDFNADGTVHDAVIDGLSAGMVPGEHTDVQRTLVSMAKEIRQRRAADLTADTAEDAAFQRGRESVEHWKQFATPVLTAEEREALAWMRRDVVKCGDFEHSHWYRIAIAVIAKLLKEPNNG